MAVLRVITRYWFVAPLLLLVVLLQLGCEPITLPNITISPIVLLPITATATLPIEPSLKPEKIMFIIETSTAQVQPRVTNTIQPTMTPGATPSPSATLTPILTPVSTLTPVPTLTPTLTLVPTLTLTPIPTLTSAPTLTPTPTLTLTSTATLTPTAAYPPTPTVSPTFTPTLTPIPTVTPIFTPTVTPTVTSTPSPSPTATPPATLTLQPTPIAQGFTTNVPILMYHYLSKPPVGADSIRRDLSVSPEQFAKHLAYLQAAGYQTISLKQLSYALSQQSELPPKPIIITFDDGYRDNYENAFPLLKEYGFSATFFVFTQVIDTYNISYLTWEMVIEMHQAGMEFGSHSYRHPDLRNRDNDFLVYEILGSKEAIEARIQEPVRFFSYPAGRYDAQTIKVLQSADFWGALTTHWGGQQSFANRYEMPRVRVSGGDSVAALAEKLKLVTP